MSGHESISILRSWYSNLDDFLEASIGPNALHNSAFAVHLGAIQKCKIYTVEELVMLQGLSIHELKKGIGYRPNTELIRVGFRFADLRAAGFPEADMKADDLLTPKEIACRKA
jgi:hypothetical protein